MDNKIEEKQTKNRTKKNEQHKNFIIKIILLIIFVIIILVTGFKSGQKFYILKNTNFDATQSYVDSGVARWYFDASIKY